MRTRDPSYERSVRKKRGEVAARRAGSRGPKVYDTAGNDVTAPEIQFIGGTVSGDDDELAIVTINGTGQQATNNSGQDLNYGDVVILDTDGTIVTTTTAQDTRPVGVVQVGATDGSQVHVVFSGYVAQVNTTASVTGGNYAETSSTAGAATENVSRRIGSFGQFLATGENPPGRLFGVPDSTSTSGGATSAIYTNSGAGSMLTVDLAAYTVFDITLTANCTLTFTNTPAGSNATEWIFILRQGGSGSYTVTWPVDVSWQDSDGTSGGSAPTLFTAVGAEDVFRIATLDGATFGGASVRGDYNLLLNKPAAGASSLDGLSDVTITAPAEGDTLRYVSGEWINDNRRWEPVTTNPGTGPELVWDGDDIVMNWTEY